MLFAASYLMQSNPINTKSFVDKGFYGAKWICACITALCKYIIITFYVYINHKCNKIVRVGAQMHIQNLWGAICGSIQRKRSLHKRFACTTTQVYRASVLFRKFLQIIMLYRISGQHKKVKACFNSFCSVDSHLKINSKFPQVHKQECGLRCKISEKQY